MSTHAPGRSILLVLAGTALALPLLGCGSSRPVILDTERVERAVEASILTQRQLHASAPRYERVRDFRRLCERLDQRGAFRNAWLERHVFT